MNGEGLANGQRRNMKSVPEQIFLISDVSGFQTSGQRSAELSAIG